MERDPVKTVAHANGNMADLFHECGVAAIYHLPGETSSLAPLHGRNAVSRLIPRLLLDIQNRGQLAAGMTSYHPDRNQLILSLIHI